MNVRKFVIVAAVLFFAASAFGEDRPGWVGMGITPTPGQKRPAWLHVRHIAKDGPAEAAGMQSQDVITHIDGKPVAFTSDAQVLQFFGSLKPQQKVKFTVRRTTGEKVVTVVAAPMSDAMYERWKQSWRRVEADRQRQ